ncbi:MAG: HAMP domain-containing sensor histidine kinase [Gemmatimonadota bacterium]
MTVRSKLLAGFGVAIATLLLPGLFAADRLSELQNLAVEGRSRHADALLSLGRMQAALAELDRYERSFVATGDAALGRSASAALGVISAEYARMAGSPYQGTVTVLAPLVDDLTRLAVDVEALMDADQIADATTAFTLMEAGFTEAERTLDAITDSINTAAQNDLVRAEALSAAARRGTLIATVLALLVALAVATWASTTLTQPLRRLGRAMAKVADGDFEPPTNLPVGRNDEIGELATSFQVMSHRLADLNRMKAEFIGVASHELKTPINSIHGYAELIQEEYGDSAPEEYRRMVDGIAEQARVVVRLVDRLMDLSRLETGTYRMQWEHVHVQDLVTGLLRGFEILARQRSVQLVSTVHDGTPEVVSMDLDLMRDEVLGNLVANALRHTPSGGRVEIEASATDDGIAFTVTDSGPGIPADERDLIFRKYYRSDPGSTGSGLGLAIARETVLLHGGSISLEDTPAGTGARFRVVIPHRADIKSDAGETISPHPDPWALALPPRPVRTTHPTR